MSSRRQFFKQVGSLFGVSLLVPVANALALGKEETTGRILGIDRCKHEQLRWDAGTASWFCICGQQITAIGTSTLRQALDDYWLTQEISLEEARRMYPEHKRFSITSLG